MMGLGLPLCSVARNELFRFVNGAQGARGELIMLKIYLLCYAALLKKSTSPIMLKNVPIMLKDLCGAH